MKRKDQNPAWWQLYLIFPLLIALFLFDDRLRISTGEHEIVQIGFVLFIFLLIYLWMRSNERALSRLDRLEHPTTFRMVFPAATAPREDEEPLIQYPDTEIKGLLGDTFEINCNGGKQLPVDDVSKR